MASLIQQFSQSHIHVKREKFNREVKVFRPLGNNLEEMHYCNAIIGTMTSPYDLSFWRCNVLIFEITRMNITSRIKTDTGFADDLCTAFSMLTRCMALSVDYMASSRKKRF